MAKHQLAATASATTWRHQPRKYLEQLEQRVLLLESQLREARSSAAYESPYKTSPDNGLAVDFEQASASTAADDGQELGDLSSMIGTLSLNAAGAEPSYLGPSSTFAFTRFVKPSLGQAIGPLSSNALRSDLENQGGLAPEPCALPEYHIAMRLSNAYFHNIHAQYPFLHEPTFRKWEAALADPFGALSSLNFDPLALYFLNMVYAVGAVLLPNLGHAAEQLYTSAMLYIDEILCHDNLESIQAVLCCAAYSIRSSKGTSHWKLSGHALRQCINLGYHRNHRRLRSTINQFQQEMQKRAFWSAYVMECAGAVMLGRPLALHFQEIDAEFPLDIHESQLSPEGITGSPRSPAEPPTMMTYAIHGFRIRSLLGCIQTALYSDVTLKSPEIRQARVEQLSVELETWWASNPPPIVPPKEGALSFYMTPDFYETNYHYAILQLYRVQITDRKTTAPDDVFLKCLEVSRKTCRNFWRQFLGKQLSYTWGAVHELFLAGLTYIYCLWTSPAARGVSRQDQVSSTCTDCTMVLVILAERWPEAASYRDIFEVLASRTMTMLTDVQQGKMVGSTALVQGQEAYPEDLPQWMAGISDTGYSTGADWLLSELIDEYPNPDTHVHSGSWQ
ncbi:fungal-specific transcription factor domain-containing protein [Emericellopsis atlantica]|uniref:Fungal-specific transcription factor domain-containing protein n=1 Tax=Emericellopsis atlantica TaxID=2614577 RepID=A0A9P8CNR7_9HYPO|nr:fungal-specific transcription factor domain-containing protein [Emericellopsis atlantica]KAG9254069.1 fungal-specific transcription factor domain-containing protein [Emericellopsis atlantica]